MEQNRFDRLGMYLAGLSRHLFALEIKSLLGGTGTTMATIPEQLNLAVQHYQAGRLQAAEMACRQILAAAPQDADALHLMGLIALRIGRPALAIQHIQCAIHVNGLQAQYYNSLGTAYSSQGRLDEAAACFMRALELQADLAEAHFNLGVTWKRKGALEEAAACFQRAVHVRPDYAEAHNNLGAAHYDQGRFGDAEVCYLRASQLMPGSAGILTNLGNALRELGKIKEAITCYRQALVLKPDDADVRNNLGNVLRDLKRWDEAVDCYQRALALRPNCVEALNNLATVRLEQGQPNLALAGYQRALEVRPTYAAAHHNLGTYYQQIGDFEGAQRCWREALRHEPLHAEALADLAKLLRARLPAEEFAALERLASAPELTPADRASLQFGMAYVRDAQADYAAAAQHLAIANSLCLADHRAHGHAYDPVAHERLVAIVIDTFSPAHFERVRGFGAASERPVFIVGLPRTGTTLAEQILAGHSQVFGAGELNLAGTAFESLPEMTAQRATPLECVAALHRQTAEAVACQYLKRLEAFDECALRIIDKMPENYLYLGFLSTLFPQARFIHCRRDGRDVALSCWMTNFREIYWSNEIDHIAARFRAYERLMDHWRQVLPARILEVDYEALVADFEGTVRRLIDWCGLDWEPQCLSFHTRRDPVRTASAAQVRRTIYKHAVGRWKHYEDVLAPLFAAVSHRHESGFNTNVLP